MAYPGLAREEHQYLGKDYCTGYTDVDGKWNTGFYCPQYGSKTAVFCCGNDAFKYCCTDQKPVDASSSDSAVLLDGDDPNFGDDGVSSAVFVRVPIVFGVVCGIAAVLILLVVAACYFCSCCFAFKKRRDDPSHLPVGLYRTSNSTTSNLLNLYSPAGTNALTANSLATTPLDLDWTLQHHNNLASGPSSISSTYRSQQQYPPLQFPVPGNGTLAPALAAVLSQRGSQSSTPSSLLYSSGCGSAGASTPSVINNVAAQNRLQPTTNATFSAAAYHNLLNSSTSTLSSTRQIPPAQLPQQISNAASIVSSYLASIQQQGYIHPDTPMTPLQPPPPYERARHPSPPPTYFQTISAYQNGNNARNTSSNRSYSSNNNTNRTRMASIQSVLGGNANYSSVGCNIDDDLTDFILRHENTLRRTLSMGVDNNNTTRSNMGNNNRNSRGNSMLTHRELMELLLRLTHNPPPPSSSSGSSTISRSESRAGSDSTTRSTASSAKLGINPSAHHLGAGTNMTSFGNKNTSVSNCTLTINELDEDLTQNRGSDAISKTSKAELNLTSASRIADNDSGVPSSTCSTAGSEASAVIGTIKAISRDFSEEAVKLKKQHALDDDEDENHHHAFTSSCSGVDLVRSRKLHQQQLAASIQPETNCVAEEIPTTDSIFSGGGVVVVAKACDGGSDVEIIMESTPNAVHNGEGVIINYAKALSPPTVPNTVPCENVISSSSNQMQ